MRSFRLLPAFAVVLFIQLNACAQSADTQDKIQQVEKNLSGNIQIEGEAPYTITDRMAFYKIKGVSKKAMDGPMIV